MDKSDYIKTKNVSFMEDTVEQMKKVSHRLVE